MKPNKALMSINKANGSYDWAMASDEQSSAPTNDHAASSGSCPLPLSHDRLEEAHYFLHRMLDKHNYHYPEIFRYNANAFLTALQAVEAMLVKELERASQSAWLRPRRAALREDPVLSRFARGRNIILHQKAIVQGSQIESGIFRGPTLKLAIQLDVSHDRSSVDILTQSIQPQFIGWLIDEEHSAIGEQLGLRRIYYVKELSESEDAVTASYHALTRLSVLLAEAHSLLNSTWPPYEERGEELNAHDVRTVSLLLETDLDPDAIERWGW